MKFDTLKLATFTSGVGFCNTSIDEMREIAKQLTKAEIGSEFQVVVASNAADRLIHHCFPEWVTQNEAREADDEQLHAIADRLLSTYGTTVDFEFGGTIQ